jgi:hypothetical protein
VAVVQHHRRFHVSASMSQHFTAPGSSIRDRMSSVAVAEKNTSPPPSPSRQCSNIAIYIGLCFGLGFLPVVFLA